MKRHIQVRNFERHTGTCPTYIAWQVLDEARDYLRAPIPERHAGELARRAEAVFKKHEFWRRKYRGAKGREWLLASMRHWLAATLAKEKPALFRQLPDEFKVGHPLPPRRPPGATPERPVMSVFPAGRRSVTVKPAARQKKARHTCAERRHPARRRGIA